MADIAARTQTSPCCHCCDGKQDCSNCLGRSNPKRTIQPTHSLRRTGLRDSKTCEMMVHKSAAKTRTPRRMTRAPQPALPLGTRFAEPIRASGQNRANRPDTRLLLTNAQIRSKRTCYAGAIHTRHSLQAQRLTALFTLMLWLECISDFAQIEYAFRESGRGLIRPSCLVRTARKLRQDLRPEIPKSPNSYRLNRKQRLVAEIVRICPLMWVSLRQCICQASENTRQHCSNISPYKIWGVLGWGGRIRTYDTRYQKPLPYHLATPQQCRAT